MNDQAKDLFDDTNVIDGISLLKNGKAAGTSFVTAELLKATMCKGLVESLRMLFNYVGWTDVPTDWNTLKLSSLFKNKGSVMDPNMYRGLSVMSTIPKLYSILLNANIDKQACERKLRAPVQCGFRKGYRLEDNCVILKTMFEKAAK